MSKLFNERKTAPKDSNKYFRHTSKGGYNTCIHIKNGMCIPNCTGYAQGRFNEIAGITKNKLPDCNAESFIRKNTKYKTGKVAKLGAICVWGKGIIGVGKDGAGHVAIVEKINSDGTWASSESAYGGAKFFSKTYPKNNKRKGYKFLGFIYQDEEYIPKVAPKPKYTIGTYEVVSPRYVRTGAGTEFKIKKYQDLTKDGQKNTVRQKRNADAQYKKGTRFTAQSIVTAKNGSIWAKTPSGYVCIESSKNTVYCKKIK